ncbi:MAG: DUF2752 domain-containing protein [Phycisphaerales bacterium]|nr:DUF2752 domain-containing protein [Phycisphaerales bacterium]
MRGRVIAGLVAVAAVSPLVTAAVLSPAASGIGTHRSLGLPACGWQTNMGLPCPTCGMTTAFSHAVRADFLAAATTQPAGLLACVLVAMAALGGVYAAVSGAPMQHVAGWFVRPAVVWAGIGVLLVGWSWKLVQAGGAA